MLSRLHHQFKLAAPLLGPLSILVFVFSWWEVATTKQVADGVDELTATLAGPMQFFNEFAARSTLWLAGIALVVTAMLAGCATWRLSRHGHARKRASRIEHLAFWVGVFVVPLAYIVAPAIIGVPLLLIFCFAMIETHRP